MRYTGISTPPVIVFFIAAGIAGAFRRVWGWALAILALATFGFVRPFYLFGIEHLGLHLSQNPVLLGAVVPIVIVAAFGANTLLTATGTAKRARLVFISSAVVVAILILDAAIILSNKWRISGLFVLAVAAIVFLLRMKDADKRPFAWMAALVIALVATSVPLFTWQQPQYIAQTSAFIEKIRADLPAGSRYANVGKSSMNANVNAIFGLPSVHSYNSLSSGRYHALVAALGGEMTVHGRYNKVINPDYASTAFWMSNIGLILAFDRLTSPHLTYLGEEARIHFHRVASRMGKALQVDVQPSSDQAATIDLKDPRVLVTHTPSLRVDQGDWLELDVHPGPASVLVLSQAYHRDWHAEVLGPSGWSTVPTILVNGWFQGAVLPADTRQVRLRFLPWVRFVWIGHAAFSALLTAAMGIWMYKRLQLRRSTSMRG